MNQSFYTKRQWKQGSGIPFSSLNPATGEQIWEGAACTNTEVNEVIKNARNALTSWSALSIDERSQYLLDFSYFIDKKNEDIATLISKETGKPLWESKNEVRSMVQKVKISLDAYGHRCAGMMKAQENGQLITRHRPHGVVAIFGPYNFPGHLPTGHIIPALLAGNTIIFKPSEFAPLVAEKIVECWHEINLPSGVLNLTQGGRETGQQILNHADIDGLFFTGSYATGQQLLNHFGTQPGKILALEMGGNNPLVIGTVENLQAAAYLTIQSAYLSSGQRCTCASRLILVDNENNENFLNLLKKMIAKLSVGPYWQEPEPFMGPLITETHAFHVLKAQEELLAKGGSSIISMKQLKTGTGFLSPGLMDVTAIKDLPDEEIFGPFLQLIRVPNMKQAVEVANQTKYGLVAGLLSDQRDEYDFFLNQIKAGVINWNMPTTGASSEAPFGGIKCSGNHRPSAYYAADYCAYPIASLESSELKFPAHILPGIGI
jgi:succinylglutamic semialdehyde dehydrogenase